MHAKRFVVTDFKRGEEDFLVHTVAGFKKWYWIHTYN